MKRHSPMIKAGLLAIISVVTLTACTSAVTVSRQNVAQNYLPEELYVVATGQNQLRTTIIGQPFDIPRDAFEAAVLAGLEGKNFGPRLNLSTDPQQEDQRKRRVVLAFNLVDIGQADKLCAGEGQTARVGDTGGLLSVTGVYCGGGGQYLTQATARAQGVAGPDSEQFRQLMTQLAIALFPDENPHRQDDDGPVLLNP